MHRPLRSIIITARASNDPEQRAKVRCRRPGGRSAMHRIRATLRHALNIAIEQDRLIDFNPSAVVELPDADKPRALVRTDERVTAWNQDLHQRLAADRERRTGGRGQSDQCLDPARVLRR
ncbi:hypothetical protein ABZ897_58685 [Nonomuraea sp. NPDC046802]|uniref:hypothetical protein n=1 Tax=Nonomuraea sp. NPDC046802 TaxID=3154919 RepID=UPI00340043F7